MQTCERIEIVMERARIKKVRDVLGAERIVEAVRPLLTRYGGIV